MGGEAKPVVAQLRSTLKRSGKHNDGQGGAEVGGRERAASRERPVGGGGVEEPNTEIGKGRIGGVMEVGGAG